MKFAKLVHNPGAGEGSLSKDELVFLIQSAGFGCSYSSTKKKGWEKIESAEIDFLILAGGDGTVRKVAGLLLDKNLLEKKLPIGLLPFGTANNIAKTLKITGSTDDIVESWNEKLMKKFDVGRLYGVPKMPFFLESFGYGVFPELIACMKEVDEGRKDTPEKSLTLALNILKKLLDNIPPQHCTLSIDGVQHDGKYLMVEVMNTVSIGPNLKFAPLSDPGDGFFEVVLVADSQREELIDYVHNKILKQEVSSPFKTIKANQIEIFWEGSKAHVDDQLIEMKKPEAVKIELLHGLLEFFVTEHVMASA